MEESLESVYARLLEEYAEKQDMPIDEFIQKKLAEAGVNEEERMMNNEACAAIDRINKNAKEIDVAIDNGFTPMQWLRNKIQRLVKSKSDDEKECEVMMEIYTQSFPKILGNESLEEAAADNEDSTQKED